MDKESIIAQCDLAKGFTSSQIDSLAQIALSEEYSTDDLVIHEDDKSRDLFIIYKGWLSIELQRPEGYSSCKVQILKSKGIVGEVSFLDGSRRTASVICQEDVKCLRLPFDKLQSLIESDSNLGYHLMRNIASMLCSKMRDTNFELRNQILW